MDLVYIVKSVVSDIVKEEILLFGIFGIIDVVEFIKVKKEFLVIIFGLGNEIFY